MYLDADPVSRVSLEFNATGLPGAGNPSSTNPRGVHVKRQSLIILTITALLCTTVATAKPGAKAGNTVTYDGQMIGPDNSPVSGIYQLQFSLHRSEKARNSIWKEKHEVAVTNGFYRISLGALKPIPKRFKLEQLYLSVAMVDGPELVREPLKPLIQSAAQQSKARREPTKPATKRTPRTDFVAEADRAEFANEAEVAANATRLEGKTLDEVVRYVKTSIGGRTVLVSKSLELSGHAGGVGGKKPFEVMCPRGYVAVGVQGRAGRFIDGFELICASLKTQ